ncbi:hypothetical protein Gotur_026689 [Gossypium turneri]
MWLAWKKQIKELLEEIENDQVADEPVIRFGVRNISKESLEKRRNAHLVVAALIATVAFAAAITVPGGLQSEKGSEQGTPLLIDEAAFKTFVVTPLFSLFMPSPPTLGFWIIFYHDLNFGVKQFHIELGLFLGSLAMQRLR